MLQSIRDRTQGWFAGIIIAILIVSFALWGIHSYLVGAPSNVIAKVNGVEITKGQLAIAYERLRRHLQAQYSSSYALPEDIEASLKQRALQTVISIQVLLQASIDQNYRVSARQVDNYLESMPEFLVNGQFSLTRFQQLLASTLFNANDFLELIKTSLLIDQPRLGLVFSAFSLPSDVTNTVALINQERDVAYLTLTPQAYMNQSITILPDKIEAYYKAHQDDFKTPEQASIEYVLLSTKALGDLVHPTEQMIKSFYDENSNSYTQPSEWKLTALFIPIDKTASSDVVTTAANKAQGIYESINKGDDFNRYAHDYPAGKDLEKMQQGWVTLNQIPNDLQKAALSLNKNRLLSTPIRVENGIVLLKAVDYKDAVVQPYLQVKDKVKEALVHQKAEEKFAELKDKLANVVYEHPDSLQSAAKLIGLPIHVTELFNKDKGIDEISKNNKVREAAFSHDVLVLQNNSDVIQISNDAVVVLRIKTHVPATLLSLQAVEKQIEDKLEIEAVDLKTAQLSDEIKTKLQSGESSEKIATEYHVNWVSLGMVGRHSKKIDSAILDAAFAAPHPSQNTHTASYTSAKTPSGYVIIAVKAVKDGSIDQSSDQFNIYAEQIQNAQGILEYELYKQSLMDRAKIVVN